MKKMTLPLSPAVKAERFVFLSGYPGYRDRKTEALVEGIEAQTRETLEVIRDTLEATGSSLEKVVKVTVFLKNAQDFAKMNEVYRTFFPKDPPARSTIVTDLVLPEMLIEIECIAMV
ncbi:MAG TPA: RidA family protein [Dehalococcoidia bacterium]|nr:RidA family protein [Dehalococcoidia bacterium]